MRVTALASLVVLLAAGCSSPDTGTVIVGCTPIPGEACDDTGGTGGDTGDTGDTSDTGDTGGPAELGPDECVHNTNEFDVYTDALVVTNGTYSLTADRAQISLWTQAEGYKVFSPTSGLLVGYEIPAGAGHLLVSGMSGTIANRFMGVNSTDIWIVANTGGTWDIDSFDIEYEDGASNSWTLTLDDSSWD